MFQRTQVALVLVVALVTGVRETRISAADGTVRVATYNTSLFRSTAGQLIRDLENGNNEQARNIAEVIQRVRPDILLLNEFDYDASGHAARHFRAKYLAVGQNGCQPIDYPFSYAGPVNTGEPSGRDLNHNGTPGEPDDAFGYGKHPGQYGMRVLSRYEMNPGRFWRVRTFRKFLWRDMPNAMLPKDPKTGTPFYDEADLDVLRLSSKSFWDVEVTVPAAKFGEDRVGGKPSLALHLLCSHPTPPVFDGPEDRNGCRNHDEIRLIADYIDPEKSKYLVDDAGRRGGLPASAEFIILGDLNCDPVDGDSVPRTMDQLLKNPRVNASFTPTSEGGPLTVAMFPDQFTKNRGDSARVTSNFTKEGHGCLRIDYVLPSRGLEVMGGGVFWPKPGEPGSEAIIATDHHLVWIDIRPASQPAE
jgi:endonuclease/exonuclease/phosphatase family metal-dependent hydrolase